MESYLWENESDLDRRRDVSRQKHRRSGHALEPPSTLAAPARDSDGDYRGAPGSSADGCRARELGRELASSCIGVERHVLLEDDRFAREIGHPTTARAVGAANGKNPIAIIAPCHRVIGSTGKLTGFAGGLPAKEHLLTLEQGTIPAVEGVGLGTVS